MYDAATHPSESSEPEPAPEAAAAPAPLRALVPPSDYAHEPTEQPDYVPVTDDRSPWLDTPLEPIGRPLAENTFVDVAIVGAGFTGLMCAHALARLRPDWRILVIDGLKVGQSASGRNSGYLMDIGHWHPDWDLDVNRGVSELSTVGIEQLARIVDTADIDCDWFDGGRYHVAVNNRGKKALAGLRQGMRQLGRPFEELSPEALAERIGTTHYTEGFHMKAGALVNPAKLVRGLARALPESVRLVEDTIVEQVVPGQPHRLQTANHFVNAARIVLASNGFLPALGLQRGRVLPFATYASITEPLPSHPGTDAEWGVVPEEKMGATVRLTRDNRILIRNGVRYRNPPNLGASMCARLAKEHRKSLQRRFPEYADVPFTHTWGGTLGVTMNDATVFGSFGERAWACGAHNGVGMALGAGLGEVLAHDVAGTQHRLAAQARTLPQPAWMPPEPFRSVGISAYTWFLGLLAGAEK